MQSSFRTVHSQVRQFARQGKHSRHRHLIDPGLIGSTVCLQTAFDHFWQWLRLLSAFVTGLRTRAFTANARPSRVGVSGRYPVIPPIKLSVHRLIVPCPCASFLPLANKSHSSKTRPRLCRLPWCLRSASSQVSECLSPSGYIQRFLPERDLCFVKRAPGIQTVPVLEFLLHIGAGIAARRLMMPRTHKGHAP